jgi:hypothetical protein
MRTTLRIDKHTGQTNGYVQHERGSDGDACRWDIDILVFRKKSMVAVLSSATRVIRCKHVKHRHGGIAHRRGDADMSVNGAEVQKEGLRDDPPISALIALWTRHLEQLSCHLHAWRIATCNRPARSINATEATIVCVFFQ